MKATTTGGRSVVKVAAITTGERPTANDLLASIEGLGEEIRTLTYGRCCDTRRIDELCQRMRSCVRELRWVLGTNACGEPNVRAAGEITVGEGENTGVEGENTGSGEGYSGRSHASPRA